MGEKQGMMRFSAETVFLIRCWQEADGTPCYLLEMLGDKQKRRLFQQLPEMTAHLSALLMPMQQGD